MYDQDNFEYSVDFCPRGNESSLLMLVLQNGFFNDRENHSLKTQENTSHSKIKQDQQKQNPLENEEILASDDEENGQVFQKVSVIECCKSKLFRLQKIRKGRPKERKNIKQILKTETLLYLSMLAQFKILNEQQKSWALQFKQETVSAASFQKLIKKQNIREKMQQFYHSPELVQRILSTPRITFSRKMEVIKNLKSCSILLADFERN